MRKLLLIQAEQVNEEAGTAWECGYGCQRSNFSGRSGGLGVAEDHHPPQGCAQAHSHPSLP